MDIEGYQPTVTQAPPSLLRQWLHALETGAPATVSSASAGESPAALFDRLCLLCETDPKVLAQGDAQKEKNVRETLRWAMHDLLMSLFDAPEAPDVETLVSCFRAMVAYHPPRPGDLYQINYERFFRLADPLLSSQPAGSPSWTLLTTLKQYYSAATGTRK